MVTVIGANTVYITSANCIRTAFAFSCVSSDFDFAKHSVIALTPNQIETSIGINRRTEHSFISRLKYSIWFTKTFAYNFFVFSSVIADDD